MFCHRCGAENEDSARFCTRCGVALTKPSVLHRRAPWVRIAAAGLTVVVLVALLVILVRMLWPGPHVAPQPTTTPVSAATFPLPTRVPPAFTDSPSPTAVPPTPTPELGTSNLYLEYIVDASGSMNERLSDGTVKLSVARKLLTEHLRAFRPETNIGLRAYGHRVNYKQRAESCADIELVAAVEKGQVERIVTWLDGFEAQGMTPLAEAIRGATADFVSDPARINSVVLLSDGEETCGGDPCKLVEDLKAQGVNFTIHVIGLNVDEPTREQLMCIAQQAGGTYHDAKGQQGLQDALVEINRALRSTEAITPPQVATPTPMLPTGTNTATMAPSETPVSPTPTSRSEGRIAFWSDRGGKGGIYLMQPDGTGITRLISVHSVDLACLPDGKHVGFVDSSPDGNGYDIRVVSVDNAEETRLTGIAGLGSWTPLSWSPDGKRIAFSTLQILRDSEGSAYFSGGVVVMDSDGSNPTLVREGASEPSWSPDGSQIAFVWNTFDDSAWRKGSGIMGPDGTLIKALEGDGLTGMSAYLPSWSPDGMRLAFGANGSPGGGDLGIYAINVRDGQTLRLSDGSDHDPHWSLDGTRLVFQRLIDQTLDIYVMNADGSDQRNLTDDAADDWFPCWLP